MLKERREAGARVATALFNLEAALDAAYAAAAEYNGALPQARRIAGISAVIGQEAFDLGPQILAAISNARARTVESHHSLEAVRIRVGLREHAFGDELPKPDPSASHDEEARPLRAVA